MAKIKEKTLELIRGEAQSLAEPLGLEIVGVNYLREDGLWYLRISIKHAQSSPETPPPPITLDDCAKLHRPLSKRLDELDPIPGSYYLEITS
ncbi:hypothetical protein IJT93_00965 [bacterium]|nr:hypothetical protein [bacterium]